MSSIARYLEPDEILEVLQYSSVKLLSIAVLTHIQYKCCRAGNTSHPTIKSICQWLLHRPELGWRWKSLSAIGSSSTLGYSILVERRPGTTVMADISINSRDYSRYYYCSAPLSLPTAASPAGSYNTNCLPAK